MIILISYLVEIRKLVGIDELAVQERFELSVEYNGFISVFQSLFLADFEKVDANLIELISLVELASLLQDWVELGSDDEEVQRVSDFEFVIDDVEGESKILDTVRVSDVHLHYRCQTSQFYVGDGSPDMVLAESVLQIHQRGV